MSTRCWLLKRCDGELMICALAAERFNYFNCIINRFLPLLTLHLGLHVKSESSVLRFSREQQLILEPCVSAEGLPRVSHFNDVIGEVVRFSERVLAFADASVRVLHENHDFLEDESVSMLVLLIPVRLDVQIAVEQQPSVLRQLVAIRQVQINYRLADLLNYIQLFTITLHFVDILSDVDHRFFRPL